MRVMKFAAAVAALSIVGFATQASADIQIIDGHIAGNPDENVLLTTGATGTTVFGTTNNTLESVTFEGNGTEVLLEDASGQAVIKAVDGSYNYLKFYLTDPGMSFDWAEFNLNPAVNGSTTITATDQFGNVFTSTFGIDGAGENDVNVLSILGQHIKTITISTTVGLDDVRQVRLGGVAEDLVINPNNGVPEPATWAMMILGMGMVGMGLRMRRRATVNA